jgi:hypothetical protein
LVAFKTDTDISQKAPRRERELQAWQADLLPPVVTSAGPTHGHHPGHHNDDVTFGAGSSGHVGWNQFTANEKLFGVKTGFDEELYTTKLDRSGADFAEREKRAQALANEIMRVCLGYCPPIRIYGSSQGTTNNPHILEERVMNNAEDSGVNEEDKYVNYLPLSPARIHRVRSGTVRSFVARMPMFHRERERILLPLPHLLRLVVLQSRDPMFPRCPLMLQTAPMLPIPIRPRRPPRRKRLRPRLPPLKRYFPRSKHFHH